jgi:hypothetical protein
MNGPGTHIGKALRGFTKAAFPLIRLNAAWMRTQEEAELCLWMSNEYDAAIKALMALPEFRQEDGGSASADLYLCGYYRGLQMATYLMKKRNRRAA